MTEQLRRRVNTRARLIEAAAELTAEAGTTRLAIDEVCRRAGFTRGAFYSNFASIDELLFALYETKTEELLAAIGTLDPAPVDEGVEDAVDRFLTAVPADAHWYSLRAAFALRAPHDGAVADALHEHAEDMRRRLTPYVVRMAGPDGELVDADEATRVVIAAHVGSVLQGPLVDDPDRLRRDTVLAAVRGLPRRAGGGPEGRAH